MKPTIVGGELNVTQRAAKTTFLVVPGAASILLLPLLAMQFTDDVAWDLFDFALAGALLVGTALMFVMVTRKMRNPRRRAAIGVAFALALILIWLELAVGVIGTPLGGT